MEELKKNIGIKMLKLRYRTSGGSPWLEFTTPEIERQLLLTRKLAGTIRLESVSL